jgi:hypothetical protein
MSPLRGCLRTQDIDAFHPRRLPPAIEEEDRLGMFLVNMD